MHHRLYENDEGHFVQEFDDAALDYFIEGLQELRDGEVGSTLSTPSVTHDPDGIPESVGEFIIMKVEASPDGT